MKQEESRDLTVLKTMEAYFKELGLKTEEEQTQDQVSLTAQCEVDGCRVNLAARVLPKSNVVVITAPILYGAPARKGIGLFEVAQRINLLIDTDKFLVDPQSLAVELVSGVYLIEGVLDEKEFKFRATRVIEHAACFFRLFGEFISGNLPPKALVKSCFIGTPGTGGPQMPRLLQTLYLSDKEE